MDEDQQIDPTTGLPMVPMVNQGVPTPPAATPPGGNGQAELMKQYLKLARATGPVGMEERDIARQQAIADELRKTGAPTGLNPTGRVYTAANPLQFLASGLDAARGESMQPGLEKRRGANQKMLIDALAQAAGETPQPNVINTTPMQEMGY